MKAEPFLDFPLQSTYMTSTSQTWKLSHFAQLHGDLPTYRQGSTRVSYKPSPSAMLMKLTFLQGIMVTGDAWESEWERESERERERERGRSSIKSPTVVQGATSAPSAKCFWSRTLFHHRPLSSTKAELLLKPLVSLDTSLPEFFSIGSTALQD